MPTRTKALITGIGNYLLFLQQALRSAPEVEVYRSLILPYMVRLGFNAIPVVALASAFAGIVTTLQTAYLLSPVLPAQAIGAIVVPTLTLELCALIPSLVMASRIGASIAAELGTMQVTDQVDALEAMGLNSVAYLVLPRLLAGIVMFPSLYAIAAVTAISAGAFAGEWLGYLPAEIFIQGARDYFLPFDVFYGATKTTAFGFLITSIACWRGLSTRGGASGVGKSTTQAVVTSCVAILFADYLLAELLL